MKYILLVLALTGCGEIYTYELKTIIDKCGGAEKIHKMWIGGDYVGADCIDGSYVSTTKRNG